MSFLFCHNLFLFIIIDFYKTSENPHPSFEQSSIGSLRHPVTGCDLVTFKLSCEIVMKSIVTWKCWMIISPFCLRLCTSVLANLYTSVWGCWSLLGERILVTGDSHTDDILCHRAAMLFKLIVLKMTMMILIIVNWLLPGTIADNLLFAFLLLNLGLK